MNTNERLTEAARRGAAGRTLPNFMQLTADEQKAVLEHVMSQPNLVSEIVRASLNATNPEELEELIAEIKISKPEPKTFHAG